MEKKHMDNRPMLNLYPDSLGGTVESLCQILDREEFADVFIQYIDEKGGRV